MKLKNYLDDGANYQARATLMLLQGMLDEELDVEVGRFENCREQGYVLSIRDLEHKQHNIAFFEHRNSDTLCAVKWIFNTINTPTVDDVKDCPFVESKYDYDFGVKRGEILQMVKWIINEIKAISTNDGNSNK